MDFNTGGKVKVEIYPANQLGGERQMAEQVRDGALDIAFVADGAIGAVLEPGPAIVIFVPLLLPVARTMGIDPLQFSIVFVLTLALGLSTPPIGLCLFIACKIGRISMGGLFRALWPFFLSEKLVVVLLVMVPWFSTCLVHLIRH